MAGGYRSPLLPLGLSSAPVVEQGGFRTPLPTWNAGAPPVVEQGGYRSFLAFWIGGATAGIAPEPEPEEPVVTGGGLARRKFNRRLDCLAEEGFNELLCKEQQKREDEEILLIVSTLISEGYL